jgi:hypothetical protein
MTRLSRRRVLRGMLNGAAVSVALPLLDCFLNDNGTAMAGNAPLPLRFGTWTWGLGMSEAVFVPRKTGTGYDLPPEIEAIKPVQHQVNLFTNFRAFKDSEPNLCHHTGWVILRSGMAPLTQENRPGETIDVTVARKLGNATRMRILSATATGDVRDSFSYENGNSVNTPEWSPVRLYQRLFGPDWQDPNAAAFKPDPKIMVRKSVLSGVMDEARSLGKDLGSNDRQRLDQYFTGLRDLERRFDLQLAKPAPIAGCRAPKAPAELPAGVDADLVSQRHRLMTELMLMAVQCDQVRVFNMFTAAAFAGTTQKGYDKPHHTATHEEAVDPQKQCQPHVSWFTRRAMQEWAYFVQALGSIREGAGSMLDNVLVFANTDQSFAKTHSIDGIPMFTAGRAGGQLKTGLHIDGGGSPNTRLGYTALKLMGLDVASWGTQSNATSTEIHEILA